MAAPVPLPDEQFVPLVACDGNESIATAKGLTECITIDIFEDLADSRDFHFIKSRNANLNTGTQPVRADRNLLRGKASDCLELVADGLGGCFRVGHKKSIRTEVRTSKDKATSARNKIRNNLSRNAVFVPDTSTNTGSCTRQALGIIWKFTAKTARCQPYTSRIADVSGCNPPISKMETPEMLGRA